MRPALAVALTASSLIAAEVILARLFALWFRASYTYLVVSGATCGLALGALVVQRLAPRQGNPSWLELGGGLLAAALALPVVLLGSADLTGGDLLGSLPLVLGITLVIFAIGGALLAALFQGHASAAASLYAADLGAAALGAPLALVLLDRLGAVRALLALSLACAGAVAWTARRRRGAVTLAIAILVASAVALGFGGAWSDLLALRVSAPEANPAHPAGHRPKELFVALAQGSRLVRTDWNAMARSDVVADGQPGRGFRIFLDGAVPTPMEAWDGSEEDVHRSYGKFIGALPYRVARMPPERVLALGAGGGLDVLLALAAGAREVDAVDVNPALPSIVADARFRGTSADVYGDPRVRLRIDEGRSFVRQAGRYDVIYVACALTNTLQGSAASIVENHLYTVEAFIDYWTHLNADGLAAVVVEDNKLADRLFLTALLALSRVGVDPRRANEHLLTAHASEGRRRMPYRHVLLMRRVPWTRAEVRSVVATMNAMRLEPRHVPHAGSYGALGQRFDPSAPPDLVAGRLAAEYPVAAPPLLWPVTDDRPFFVDFGSGLDPALARLLAGVAAATALILLAVLAWGRRLSADVDATALSALAFACLGIGFMAAETALIQGLGLTLGFPTRALAVGLGALLAGAALGSLWSSRWEARALVRGSQLACAAVVVGMLACRITLPALLSVSGRWALPMRIAACALVVGAVGVPMGVPFAAALRLLDEPRRRLIPALYGLNGLASMLGAIGTIALAKFWGYGAGFGLAIAAYVVAWVAFSRLLARATLHAAQ